MSEEAFRLAKVRANRDLAGFDDAEAEFHKIRGEPMTDLTDKIDALPKPDPDSPVFVSDRDEWMFSLDDYNALAARNALLCEALREHHELIRLLLQHSTYSGGEVTYPDLGYVRGNDSLSSAIARHRDNTRAILAACEVKP